MHVDLDHDDITWPPPQAPDPPPAEEGGRGGTAKTDSLGSGKERKKGGEEAAGAHATGEQGGGVGAPPVWPEEAARRARRVVQSTLFPDFETFDVVGTALFVFFASVLGFIIIYLCIYLFVFLQITQQNSVSSTDMSGWNVFFASDFVSFPIVFLGRRVQSFPL